MTPATARLVDEAAGLEATFVPGAGMLLRLAAPPRRRAARPETGIEAYAARGKTMGHPAALPVGEPACRLLVRTRPDGPLRCRTIRPASALDENGLPIHGVIGGRYGVGADERSPP